MYCVARAQHSPGRLSRRRAHAMAENQCKQDSYMYALISSCAGAMAGVSWLPRRDQRQPRVWPTSVHLREGRCHWQFIPAETIRDTRSAAHLEGCRRTEKAVEGMVGCLTPQNASLSAANCTLHGPGRDSETAVRKLRLADVHEWAPGSGMVV